MKICSWFASFLFLLIVLVSRIRMRILRLSCKSFADFKVSIDEYSLPGAYSVVPDTDVNVCKSLCLNDTKCKSINANKKERVCELHHRSIADIDDGAWPRPTQGWIHQTTLFDQTLMGDYCRRINPCPPRRICKDTCECPGFKCMSYQARELMIFFKERRPLTWHMAEKNCRSFGGNLISVKDEKRQNMIDSRFAESSNWIGLSSHRDGIYRWVDGSKSTYENWAANELNRYGGAANCTFVQGGQWRVLECDKKLPSLCEILRRRHYL
ncbi:proteoglycan 3-like [Rhopilema esculentum]|uniref:proteoglycan 3-like n=1 Tax=Rhopilema esculentum TaxID=499914 RepID=UPI0031DC035A